MLCLLLQTPAILCFRCHLGITQCQLTNLHDESEAPKGKNASTRILTDTATINETNTRAKGGNAAETLHHDIDFLFQQNSLPLSLSLPCSSFACPLRILLYIILCVTRSPS